MSWSYVPGASARDYVRFLIGDTDSSNELLQNEEIDTALSNEGNKYAAAAVCADALAGKFSDEADKKVGPLSISASQKADKYQKLADRLRAQIGRKVAAWAGGISESEMRDAEKDTDRVDTSFKRGQNDSDETHPADSRWTESESWARWH